MGPHAQWTSLWGWLIAARTVSHFQAEAGWPGPEEAIPKVFPVFFVSVIIVSSPVTWRHRAEFRFKYSMSGADDDDRNKKYRKHLGLIVGMAYGPGTVDFRFKY